MAVLKYRDGTGWHLLPLAAMGDGGMDQPTADARYLQLVGGTLTGVLAVPDGTLPGHAATKGQSEAHTASAVAAHAAAADPHTGYQKESEKGAANGYAALDATTKIPMIQVPYGTTGTTVALGDHTHSGYAATSSQILAGEGMTGGGDLTASRTLSVGAGVGITVNADDVAVNRATVDAWYVDRTLINAKGDLLVGSADNTLSRLAASATNGQVLTVDTAQATGVKWAAGGAASTTQVIAGAGLTGGGDLTADRTLTVGAGTGITVAADTVTVDTTVIAARSYVDARTPKITASSTAPASPATGDIWVDLA